MQLRTQIVQRNLDALRAHASLLVFGAPDAAVLADLPNAQAASFDYKQYSAYQSYQCPTWFGPPDTDTRFDAALVFLPKAKEELKLVLAMVRASLADKGAIYLVGEKKGGIASGAKHLTDFGANASKIDAAKHCQLWHVDVEHNEASFNLEDWFSHYTLDMGGTQLKLACLPGVFSAGHLDDATQLLLENLPKKVRGRILDFACGNGVIGLFIKQRFPDITLEQVDVNWLALACSQRSASLNSLDADIYASDGWSAVKGRVDSVFTNPPFHEGVHTAYDTTERFIAESPQKMSKSALFYLVANNFLRYPAHIEKALGRCDVVAETTRFRLYRAFR